MCTSPVTLPNGVVIGCRCCWQCIGARQYVWAGKCIAESKTAPQTLMVTLTYGKSNKFSETENDLHAGLLHYEDVQLYLKRLRKHCGGDVRFFAAGEYGKEKGRAHWHLILYFGGKLPDNLRFNERYMHMTDSGGTLWEHGWSYWQVAGPDAMFYATKYVLKGGDQDQRDFRFSIRPALGTAFFADWAQRHVEQGLSPQHLFYGFPEYKISKGKLAGQPHKFHMSVTAGVLFLAEFCARWRMKYGHDRWPQSDLIDKFQDQVALREKGIPELDWTVTDLAARGRAKANERSVFTWLVEHDALGKELPHKPLNLYPAKAATAA